MQKLILNGRATRWPAIVGVAILLLLQSVATAAGLPDRVAALLAAAGLPADALSFVVIRPHDGSTVISATPERPMQPASTMKLLTSTVALDLLGRGYRGRTELRSSGTVSGGVLQGDLVLHGMGDTDFDIEAFRAVLRALRDQGIRDVRGDFLLDRSWLSPARPDLGVPPFDETPEFRYNVIPDAISLNSNLVKLELVASADTLEVRMSPPLEGIEVKSLLTLTDRQCADWEDGWQTPATAPVAAGAWRIELRGDFPRNCVTSTHANVLDRTVFADKLFRSLWREMGGQFSGVTRETAGSADSRLLAEHRSRPLSEVLRDINKRSDNPITRLTFLALAGTTAADAGAAALALAGASIVTAQQSERVVRAWLRENHIDDAGLVLDNGSGLSRTEKITPRQLAEVIRVAASRPWAPEFLASLPVAGLDGGIQRRLAQPKLAGIARLKTGTLRDVTALAGFVPDRDGRMLIVSAMVNHPLATSKVAQPVVDALMEAITEIDSEPVRAASGFRLHRSPMFWRGHRR